MIGKLILGALAGTGTGWALLWAGVHEVPSLFAGAVVFAVAGYIVPMAMAGSAPDIHDRGQSERLYTGEQERDGERSANWGSGSEGSERNAGGSDGGGSDGGGGGGGGD